MKHLLSIIALLSTAVALEAQNNGCDTITQLPWTESFPSDYNECWTVVDLDGNGNNWTIDGIHPYDGSYSLVGFFSTQQEDNWAISQPIALPAGMNSATLTWQVYAHNYEETYEVLVSNNGTDDLANFQLVFGETVLGGYFERQVDLTDYLGQTIHLAFRHRSEFQNFISIDRIQVSATASPNVPLVTIEAPDSAKTGAEVTLTAFSSNSDNFSWSLPGATIVSVEGNTVTAVWNQPGTFTAIVTATNENGTSSATKSIVIYGNAASTGAATDNAVTIYPNPTTGIVAVYSEEAATLELTDDKGCIVARQLMSAGSTTLDLGSLPNGLYLLRAVTANRFAIKKIIKQ